MTREAFETALDTQRLQTCEVFEGSYRWYTCRRNGRTKTWKTDPGRFEVPIKYKFRSTMRVSATDFNNGLVDKFFRIVPEAHNG